MRFVWFVTAARVANPSLRCKIGCDFLKTLAAAVVFSVAALKERYNGRKTRGKKKPKEEDSDWNSVQS